MNNKIVTVFGGTGFLGRHVVRELARTGARIKVATRVPERAYALKPAGAVGQIVPFACDYSRPDSIADALQGSDTVVNCVGVLFERGHKNSFQKIHAELPATIGRLASGAGVGRLVHLSALGVDRSGALYARSKLEGEKALRANFPAATILRPSVVFGEDDQFFNLFAGLAEILPALPLIGGGHTKFQPVYVADVALAVVAALRLPAVGSANPQGCTYELGGPDILSFREVYALLFHHTGRRRPLVSLPWNLAKIQASVLSLLPRPLLTPDQVELLKTDNIVQPGERSLSDLGIVPHAVEQIVPGYLARFRPGGRFSTAQRA